MATAAVLSAVFPGTVGCCCAGAGSQRARGQRGCVHVEPRGTAAPGAPGVAQGRKPGAHLPFRAGHAAGLAHMAARGGPRHPQYLPGDHTRLSAANHPSVNRAVLFSLGGCDLTVDLVPGCHRKGAYGLCCW